MKLNVLAATAALAVATTVAAVGDGRAAEIKVLCSNGFQAVMAVLGPQYEKATGHKLAISYGLAAVLGRQIEAGESFDLAILAPPQIDGLIKQNKIAAASRVVLAKSGMGVMVRTGAPKPDVSTVEAFKQILLKTKTVAVPGSTSGIWLTTELFPRLGIAERINVAVTPRGTGAAAMVAAGDADLAVLPTSEIMHAAGVDFAGNIATEVQFIQTFSAAIVAGSSEIEASRRLIEFLTSARAAEAIRKSGMEPLTAGHGHGG